MKPNSKTIAISTTSTTGTTIAATYTGAPAKIKNNKCCALFKIR